jgi:ankyrin repeat protein
MSGGDWKAMFQAVQENNLELVRLYLNHGIDPNYQHPEFMALPLAESVRYHHIEIMKVLLAHGANPSIKELETGMNSLEIAHKMKHQESIELLTRNMS